MSDRIQFTLGADDEHILEELKALPQHPQWPQSLEFDNTSVTRVAVRVLHAHVLDGSKEWVVVKNEKVVGKPIAIRRPQATSRVRFDVALDEADRKRLSAIIGLHDFETEAVALRVAVAHLRAIAIQLGKGMQLRWRWSSTGGALEVIDLASIARGTPAPTVAEFSFPVQADEVRPPASQELDGAHAREDKLFGILWFTVTLNRWIATRVASINARAASTLEDSISEKDARALPLEYDLRNLLDEFCETCDTILSKQFKEHPLLPRAWSSATKYEDARRSDGKKAVMSFLTARASHLRPWSELPEETLRWRNWTRSRVTLENGIEYRECPAAIEWTAVLHHWLITEDGVSPEMVAHELQTWLVDAFGVRNNEHVGRLAESCTLFNKEFYGDISASDGRLRPANEKRVELRELLNILGDLPRDYGKADTNKLPSALDTEKGRWARFVYLFLSIARVVQPVYRWKRFTTPSFDEVEPRVASLTQADLPELRARVFGGQTAIDGLHWILRGGIVPRIRSGRSWLIYGNPGSGKSTFALQLAADMARRGRIAIVCSEERAEVVSERLLMFGLVDDTRYRVISREQFETTLESGEDTDDKRPDVNGRVKGLLVIFNATREEPKLELARWLGMVSSRARVLRQTFARTAEEPATEDTETSDQIRVAMIEHLRQLQRRWRWMSVVIDSLDALEVEVPALGEPGARPDERTSMAELVRVIEQTRFWGLLVCGAHNLRKDVLSYLADAVIELAIDPTHMHRTLEMLKCRTQPFDPGPHVFQLVEQRGVMLYPNLASIQRRLRRRVTPALDRERVTPIPRHVFWPSKDSPPASGESHSSPVSKRSPNWPTIRRGSAVLLYGEPQAGKGPFLLNLMSQRVQLVDYPDWPLGTNGATLIVSFRGNAQEYLRPLRESRSLSEQWSTNVSDIGFCSYGVDDTLHASQVAFELIRYIRRSRRDTVPVDWIAFVGIEALHSNLPSVAKDPSFWPTIFTTTKNEGITTAFLLASDGVSPFVTQYGHEMDYILKFQRRAGTRIVDIEKSPDPPAQGGYPTLHFNLQDGEVTDSESESAATRDART